MAETRWLPERSEWIDTLPARYFDEMALIYKSPGRFNPEDEESGYANYLRADLIYGRMGACNKYIIPWLVANIPDLNERTVLEIGCGSGSATAPIALACERVVAFDIDAGGVDIAKRRCELLNIANVELFHRSADWIGEYFRDFRSITNEFVSVVFAYALLEHLTPIERIMFLQGVWKHVPSGGLLVTVELPNRLNAFDWHSSWLPFMDTLPAELARLYYAKSERREGIRDNLVARTLIEAQSDQTPLYRFGRGASFHEFQIALGNNFEIIADAYSSGAMPRHNLRGYDSEWEAALRAKLRRLGINEGFAAPSLDLIIKKP